MQMFTEKGTHKINSMAIKCVENVFLRSVRPFEKETKWCSHNLILVALLDFKFGDPYTYPCSLLVGLYDVSRI